MVKQFASLDATFSALADPTRRALLSVLMQRDATVTELAGPHSMSLPAVMKHLRVLEKAGLVSQRKVGRERRCHLTAHTLRQASDWIAQYRQFWEQRLDSLERYLSESQPENDKPKEKIACRKPRQSPHSN